ncbi:MAG: substrate-binding domain-containing protein [Candidatus Solibacter sp.]
MFIPDLSNPFHAQVVRGAEDVLRAAGYSLLLGNTYDRVEEQSRYLSVFRSKQVDGMLVFCAPDGEEELRSIVRKNVPLVFVGRVPKGFAADAISADNRAGTRLIMQHLLTRKHRRIALLTGPASLSANRHRIEAWKKSATQCKNSTGDRVLPGWRNDERGGLGPYTAVTAIGRAEAYRGFLGQFSDHDWSAEGDAGGGSALPGRH